MIGRNNDHVAFVTAYFDIDELDEADPGTDLYINRNNFFHWAKAFASINTTVVFFTDSTFIARVFEAVRKKLSSNITIIQMIDRNELYAFQQTRKLASIFEQDGYPHFYPNTVNEHYTCATHAKFDLLDIVIQKRIVKSKYLSWVDIGYFREDTNPFNFIYDIDIPPGFREDRISFLQTQFFNESLSYRDIILSNANWVSSGLFLGRVDYLSIFIKNYKETFDRLVKEKLMNTDHQVIYSMYTRKGGFLPKVPIQIYFDPYLLDRFYLGKLMRKLVPQNTHAELNMTLTEKQTMEIKKMNNML